MGSGDGFVFYRSQSITWIDDGSVQWHTWVLSIDQDVLDIYKPKHGKHAYENIYNTVVNFYIYNI